MASASDSNPYQPGTSPFHVKGLTYRNAIDFFDSDLAGGSAAVIAELRDVRLREFLSQRFLAGTWYDVLPIVSILQTAAQVGRRTPLELMRKMARESAQKDINGVYRLLLKLASPETVVERLPGAAKQVFSFVTVAVQNFGERAYRVTSDGVPTLVAGIYMASTEAYVARALELAGAREVRQLWLAPTPLGSREGLPIVRLNRELHWK
jgi:hypothetical protein